MERYISWPDAISLHLEWLAAAGRPATTRKLRRYQLSRLARHISAGPLEATTEDWVHALAQWPDWSRDTRRSHRSAVRAFTSWLHATSRTPVDAGAALPIVRATPGRPRPASEDAVAEGLATLDRRTRLMVRLAAHAGLRSCEIARAHASWLVGSFDAYSLRVLGKGDRLRVVPIDNGLAVAVREAAAGGWVFPGRCDGHLSPAYVSKLLSRALPDSATGHMLRHRYGSRAYAVGGRDIRAVQELLGHASVATTQVYVAVPDDALRRAAMAAAA